MKTGGIILAVGVLAIAAYFVYNSTSASPTGCSGGWTDYVNPSCWFSTEASTVTNELNTVLIIVALVIIAVVGLLAFGPATQHLASGVKAFL